MADNPIHTCSPQSIYGAFDQTLFLGCSVLSFTANAGLNEQSSEVTVELAQDLCVAPKTFFKTNAHLYAPVIQSISDPGFTEPMVGAPCYFRVADFEYAGIMQSWTKRNGADGNPVYSVKLTDPRILLDNIQIIVGEYQGTIQGLPHSPNPISAPDPVYQLSNIINAYGFLDSLLQNCPLVSAGDINFGALAGGWGLASSNNAGLPWNLLKSAVQVLLGNNTASPAPKYSKGYVFGPPGGNKGYGEIYTGGPAYGAGTKPAAYILDITEIPFAPAHYRVSGPIISASELISQVCRDAGCDYYIELLPTASALVIKVRVIVRTNQPAMGEIDSFITSVVGSSTSHTIGKEYRPNPNNAFIIGDKKRSLYRHTGVNTTGHLRSIQPYWGRDLDGKLNPSYEDTCEVGVGPDHWLGPPDWNVRLDFREIDGMLNHQISDTNFTAHKKLLPNGKGWVWEGELRAALGDFQSFVNFLIGPFPYCNQPKVPTDPTVLRLWAADISMVYQNRVGGGIPAQAPQQFLAGINVRVGTRGPTGAGSLPIKDAQRVHKWLQKYAQEYYGRKWLVEIPFACYAGDTGNPNFIIWSDEPSTEGAWAQPSFDAINPSMGDVNEIIGLANEVGRGSVAIDRFKSDDGRVEPILRWTQDQPPGPPLGPVPCLRHPCVTGLDYTQVPLARMVTDTFNYHAAGQGDCYVWQKAEIDDRWVTGSPYVGSEQNRVFALLTCDPVVTGFPLNEGTRAPEAFVVRSGLRDTAPVGAPPPLLGPPGSTSKKAGQFADRMLSPVAAAVPVLSNTQTYGPWVGTGIEYGTVHAEQDTTLNPWEYGGTSFMNLGALSKVENATTHMNIAERGEVTIAGYPTKGLGAGITSTITLYGARTLNIGSFYGHNFNYVPLAKSTSSASVSNMNVVVSPQGVTTSYTMTTFTPVFGRFSKNNAERIKQIGSNKLQSDKANRKSQAKALINRLSGASARANVMLSSLVAGPSYAQNSPGVILVGSLMPLDKRRKEVALADKNTLSFYGNYQNTAMMSIDGLLRPVSKSGDAGLPAMKAYTDTFCPIGTGVIELPPESPIASGASGMPSGTYSGYDAEGPNPNVNAPVAPPPPVPLMSGLIIAANYLDPFADPMSNSTFTASPRATGSLGAGGATSASGHDIESVARGSLEGLGRLPEEMWTGESMMIAGDSGRYAAGHGTGMGGAPNPSGSGDCRFLALKGPLVLQSWGYDTYGKPVPNAKGWSGDPSFDSGVPADTGNTHQRNQSGLTDRFAPNWLGDATNWPVAPVDLRYDRIRGVWTSPQPFRIMKAVAVSDIEPGETGILKLLSDGDMYDENGQAFSGMVSMQPTGTGGPGETGVVTGLPPLFQAISEGKVEEGDIVLTHYDTYSCQHWVIGGPSPGSGGIDGDVPGIEDFVCSGDVITTRSYTMSFRGGRLVSTG